MNGRVLSVRPVEAEIGIPYVGLGDLFEGVLQDVLARLSAPRRRALEGALLLVEVTDPVDTRALGLAVRDVLQVLAEEGPVLVAVDDLQWLDTDSAAALSFALRRLERSPVLLLLARRAHAAEFPELERALPNEGLHRLSLGPLSVGALHSLLRVRVDRVFARQTLLRIHEQSGGNPFYALEIAGALGARIDPTQPLPVPQSLAELVGERLAGLPAPTRRALALAATVGTASESLLDRAGFAHEVLAPAVEAGVIELQGGGIRFTHPLLASAVYDARLHGRLVEVVDDPLARSRHLALSCGSPNSDVARTLDEAAQLATERGAAALAAELNEHALRLTHTGEDEDRHRRALATARAHQAAGEWTRGQAIARELLVKTEPGPRRAEVLVLLAEFEVDALAVPLLKEALAEAEPRSGLHLRIRIKLAHSRRFATGWVAAFADARAGIAVAEELDDDPLRVLALSTAAFLGRNVSPSEALVYAARAREIASRAGDTDSLKLSAWALGQVFLDCGEYEAARESLEADYELWRERDERFAAGLLALAWVELWAGNFERAAEHAARSHEVSIQYGVETHGDCSRVPGPPRIKAASTLPAGWRSVGLHCAKSRSASRAPCSRGCWASSQPGAATSSLVSRNSPRPTGSRSVSTGGTRTSARGRPTTLRRCSSSAGSKTQGAFWRSGRRMPPRSAAPRVSAHVTRCRGLVAAAEAASTTRHRCSSRPSRSTSSCGDLFGRGPRAARARRRPETAAAEARRPRCASTRRSQRLRPTSARRPGRQRARRARPDRWAHARRRPDGGGAPRRRTRRRGAHEPRSRRRPLPCRADDRNASFARVRQARRAFARRACEGVPAGLRGRSRAKFRETHDFKLSPAA